jgi:hypothetical protein
MAVAAESVHAVLYIDQKKNGGWFVTCSDYRELDREKMIRILQIQDFSQPRYRRLAS